MTASAVSRRAVVDRLALVGELLADIRSLPLHDREAFLSDRRNLWAAESCLRRCLEALLDVGRHILAKGFGIGVSEYKEIAVRLRESGALGEEAELLRVLAGYHHEVTPSELFEICSGELSDVERVASSLGAWLAAHSDLTRP